MFPSNPLKKLPLTVPVKQNRAHRKVRPVFSAYEVGRSCRTKYELKRESPGVACLEESTPIRHVYDLYCTRPDLNFVPIQGKGNKITGYLQRQMFLASLSKSQFSRDLLMRPEMTVASVMDPRVVSIDSYASLSVASNILMKREDDIRFDPFVVSHEGKYYGISSIQLVLDGLNKYVQADMKACLKAQQRLMQNIDPVIHKWPNFHAVLQPLNGPGGDFVNYYEISDRYKLLTLFDVCGKGIKAANMVMALGSLIESMLEVEEQKGERLLELNEIQLQDRLARINRLLCRLTPDEMYATGVVVLLDYKKDLMQVLDFGHGMLWLKRGHKVFELEDHERNADIRMPFLGIDPDLYLRASTYRIQIEDIILTCSDGIVESRNSNKELFGMERTKGLLLELDEPVEIVDSILAQAEVFREGKAPADDLSIAALKI